MVIEELLQLFIREVDAELFETIKLQSFNAVDKTHSTQLLFYKEFSF